MVELADTQVLKTCEISREGASPSTMTIIARMAIVPTDEFQSFIGILVRSINEYGPQSFVVALS